MRESRGKRDRRVARRKLFALRLAAVTIKFSICSRCVWESPNFHRIYRLKYCVSMTRVMKWQRKFMRKIGGAVLRRRNVDWKIMQKSPKSVSHERVSNTHDEREVFFFDACDETWTWWSSFFLSHCFHVSSIDVTTIFNNISKYYPPFAKSPWFSQWWCRLRKT